MWEKALGKSDTTAFSDICSYDPMCCQKDAKRPELRHIIRVVVRAEYVGISEVNLDEYWNDVTVDEIKQIPDFIVDIWVVH